MTSPWNKTFEPTTEPPLTPEQREEAIANLKRLTNSAPNHLTLFNEVQSLLETSDMEFWTALAFAKGAARGAAVRTGTQSTANEQIWKTLEDLGYNYIMKG